MARGLHRLDAGGRHTQLPDLGDVRGASLTMLIMLVLQYGLRAVPAGHALLGLALIVAALVLLVRALRTGERGLVALATVALGAIGGAFVAGEVFARDGHATASFLMTVLTWLTLLCCAGTVALASMTRRDLEFDRDFADDDPDDFTPWTPPAGAPPPRTSLIATESAPRRWPPS